MAEGHCCPYYATRDALPDAEVRVWPFDVFPPSFLSIRRYSFISFPGCLGPVPVALAR